LERLPSEEAVLKEGLQFGDGILPDVNCGEVPQAGEKRGDVGGVRGSGCGFWRREEKGVSLAINENGRSKGKFDAGWFGAFFGDGVRETEFPRAAKFRDGAQKALRRARGAECSTKFHHGLIPVARGARREKCAGGSLKPRPTPTGTQVAADGGEAGEDAGNVAVKDGEFFAIGDAENCGGGISSNAGQGESIFEVVRESRIVTGNDLPRGFLEVAGAGVVAESGPEAENLLLGGFGEGADIRETREEFFVVGDDGVDAGLLEHDFGEPDAVRVAGAAPGKIAVGAGEPGE